MDLGTYLEKRNEGPADFARRLGVSISTVTRLLRRERGPSLRMASRIERVTEGMVPVHCWTEEKANGRRVRRTASAARNLT